jgi:hypothetical protein
MKLFAAFLLVLLPTLPALSQSSSSGDESWKKTSVPQDPSGTVNSSRTIEGFSKKGNRTTDKKSLETIGPDGRFVPYTDIETQTIQVNANTVRTIQRSYGRDVNGNRSLVQVTEEEKKTSANGAQDISRTTSNPDLNGRLQVVQKEIQQIKQTSPTVQESTATILMPDVNGALNPSMRVQQRETKTGEHSTAFRKSTLLPDGNGNWQTVEIREGTTKDAAQGSTTEEHVLQPGSDGKLTIVGKTVSRDTKGTTEDRATTETYSNNVPGMAADNGLHLVEKTTTVRRNDASGNRKVEQKVERLSAGNPSDGFRVTDQVIDIVRPQGDSSKREKVTTLSLDADGNMNVVNVDTAKQDGSKPVQIDTKQVAKPAPANPKK